MCSASYLSIDLTRSKLASSRRWCTVYSMPFSCQVMLDTIEELINYWYEVLRALYTWMRLYTIVFCNVVDIIECSPQYQIPECDRHVNHVCSTRLCESRLCYCPDILNTHHNTPAWTGNRPSLLVKSWCNLRGSLLVKISARFSREGICLSSSVPASTWSHRKCRVISICFVLVWNSGLCEIAIAGCAKPSSSNR